MRAKKSFWRRPPMAAEEKWRQEDFYTKSIPVEKSDGEKIFI